MRQWARDRGLPSRILTKRGIKNEPDVEIGASLHDADYVFNIVAWKRLVKSEGKKRRVPDGAPDVVCLSTEDFLDIIAELDGHDPTWVERNSIAVQCKWTERLNVTRTLGGLVVGVQEWVDSW